MSHSFIQTCCWITASITHRQGRKTCVKLWKVKLFFEASKTFWWIDWLTLTHPIFYDRSTPLLEKMFSFVGVRDTIVFECPSWASSFTHAIAVWGTCIKPYLQCFTQPDDINHPLISNFNTSALVKPISVLNWRIQIPLPMCRGVDPGDWKGGVLTVDPLKICRRDQSMFWPLPKISHSFVQTVVGCFTLSRMREWKVKLIFRGASRLSGIGGWWAFGNHWRMDVDHAVFILGIHRGKFTPKNILYPPKKTYQVFFLYLGLELSIVTKS